MGLNTFPFSATRLGLAFLGAGGVGDGGRGRGRRGGVLGSMILRASSVGIVSAAGPSLVPSGGRGDDA